MIDVEAVRNRFELLSPFLNEKTRRLMVAAEAQSIGFGGISLVARATGVTRDTIRRGIEELQAPSGSHTDGVRRLGGGRKKTVDSDPTLITDLEKLINPDRPFYDVTVRFCERYIDRKSRTRDQMVQAARSGVQNIAEGSQASGTSKKSELKLTNVARASLEELRLDYEDFLRQRGLPVWPPDHPALLRFKARRCSTLGEVRLWVEAEKAAHGRARTSTDEHGQAASVTVRGGPCQSVKSASSTLVANPALSLLSVCCYLLDRQIAAQARAFETEGGFTERLFRVRSQKRRRS